MVIHPTKTKRHQLLLLQELVEDVAFATSSRHADLSWARRFAVASPRFIGRRSAINGNKYMPTRKTRQE